MCRVHRIRRIPSIYRICKIMELQFLTLDLYSAVFSWTPMYSMELHCMRQELYNLLNLQNLQSVQNPQNIQNLQKVQKSWNSNSSHWSCILQYSIGRRCITSDSNVSNGTPMYSTGVVFRCCPVELYPRCVIRGRGAGPTCRNLSLTPGRQKVISKMAQQVITARVSLVGARG